MGLRGAPARPLAPTGAFALGGPGAAPGPSGRPDLRGPLKGAPPRPPPG